MNHFDREIIGRNIKALREAVALSQHDFSSLIEISKRSLASIEAGTANSNFELVQKVLEFFNYKIENIVKNKLKISENFREQLIDFHKNNRHFLNILSKKPNLTYAINYKLLKTNFLSKPREVNDIKLFFEELGWLYLGTSISNALKRMPDLIRIETHPTKKGTFVYSKRKFVS